MWDDETLTAELRRAFVGNAIDVTPSQEEMEALAVLVDTYITLPLELGNVLAEDVPSAPSAEELAGLSALVSQQFQVVTTETPKSNVISLDARRRSRRLRNIAAGAVAVAVLSTSGVAAAATGNVPEPVQAVAHDMGLPVSSPQYDKAMADLHKAQKLAKKGDNAGAAAAMADFDKRMKKLDSKELSKAMNAMNGAGPIVAISPPPPPPTIAPSPTTQPLAVPATTSKPATTTSIRPKTEDSTTTIASGTTGEKTTTTTKPPTAINETTTSTTEYKATTTTAPTSGSGGGSNDSTTTTTAPNTTH